MPKNSSATALLTVSSLLDTLRQLVDAHRPAFRHPAFIHGNFIPSRSALAYPGGGCRVCLMCALTGP